MSVYAEQSVIGALFINPQCIEKVYERLTAEMFNSAILGRMYQEFAQAYDEHYEMNPAVMAQKIQCSDWPEDVIVTTIKECINNTLISAEIKGYANVVIEDYKAKRLGELLRTTIVSPQNIERQIGGLIKALEALQDNHNAVSKSLAQITTENEGKYFQEDTTPKINLGFEKLDDILGGLEGGDVIVIGARPAVGKSAFATQITSHLADIGKKVGFFSLEMQEKQIYERFVSMRSGIGLTRLRRAVRFLNDEKERFEAANEELKKQENIIISTGSHSVSKLRAECRNKGYDCIVIDYLQLLETEKTYRGNRQAEVGAISKATKALAMKLNIPVIALSQPCIRGERNERADDGRTSRSRRY